MLYEVLGMSTTKFAMQAAALYVMFDASGDGFIDAYNAQLNILLQFVHDHHLYLVCPDLLVAVGEILTGYGWGSSDPHSLHYFFLFI
jgi:hypothetical protein